MKVLVTGAGALLGQGILKCLLEASFPIEVVAADPSPLSAGLYWTRKRHIIPMASDPAYLDVLRRLLRDERPDAVLIGTDVELALFARHRDELEAEYGTHILVSSPEVVAIADDKYLTYQFLRKHGFDVPRSCLAGEEDALVEAVGFPLIVKPRVGARSVGLSRVGDARALRDALAGARDVVIQECVGTPEHEYTAGVLVFDGRCDASVVMRRDLRDGNTYRAFVDHHPELNAFVREVARVLQPHGPANFQFRLDDRGRPKIFEINARFSGTTPLRMRVGFNEVEASLRHLLRAEPVSEPQIQPMAIVRHWSETVLPSSWREQA